MTYLNDFHKQTIERCLQELAASRSFSRDSETEVQHVKEMHRQIAERYPSEKR